MALTLLQHLSPSPSASAAPFPTSACLATRPPRRVSPERQQQHQRRRSRVTPRPSLLPKQQQQQQQQQQHLHKIPSDPQRPPSDPSNPASSSGCDLHCQHFQSCSGCSHERDLDRPGALNVVADFFKRRGVSDFTFHSGPPWEWRCRAKLAVRGTPQAPLIGLYEEGTHNVVDIPLCRAHHPSINAAVELLRKGISILNIEPYNEDERIGELRYVQMAVTTYNTSIPQAERYKNGKVQVTLVWNSWSENSPGSEKLQSLVRFIWRNGGSSSDINLIHSIWANFHTSADNIIFGQKWKHLLGEVDFWERIGGVDVCLSPSSFGQANTQAFDSLLRKLQKYVPYGSSVVDLYAGAGVIGLSVAVTRKCRSVRCVEINKEAKISFEKSLSRLPRTTESNISWHHADVSIDSVHWIKGSDVVIVDPPRKGLDSSLIDMLTQLKSAVTGLKQSSLLSREKNEKRPWILHSRKASVHLGSNISSDQSQSWPDTLIYISCGWDSFKEDCKTLLSSKAWHLEKAHAFNFFPGTESVEVLAIFKRGPNIKAKKKKTGKKKKKTLQGN